MTRGMITIYANQDFAATVEDEVSQFCEMLNNKYPGIEADNDQVLEECESDDEEEG